jgi:hypothetical protein
MQGVKLVGVADKRRAIIFEARDVHGMILFVIRALSQGCAWPDTVHQLILTRVAFEIAKLPRLIILLD